MNDGASTILKLVNISKSFGGLKAVSDFNLEVRKGEILGIIGPNGAGKTTLFNLITGFYPVDSGRIILNDMDITGFPPHRMGSLDVARTFQIVKPFSNISVIENVSVGAMFGSIKGVLSRRQARRKAEEVLEFTGLLEKKDYLAGSLTLGQRKRLEIARALATSPKLLLLDEAVAGLNPSEVETVIELIKNIHQRGVTLIIIEHVLKVIMTLCNRVVVLNYGEKISEGSPEEIANDPMVIEAYLGEGFGDAA
ncbi:MAG: ABC transporter ATP-binding protein [Deltaproteobacteria bacterium]|nr:MAG: ABC transporter ATP-binding protein [Deltaproteobacteria bacterium]